MKNRRIKKMNLSITKVLIAVFLSTLIIFFERAFPFILFSKKEPPAIIKFIEKFIPPMVMAVLVCYCLKDMTFISNGTVTWSGFIPYLSALIVTILLHLWKRNTLISIFGGTALYMILIRIM